MAERWATGAVVAVVSTGRAVTCGGSRSGGGQWGTSPYYEWWGAAVPPVEGGPTNCRAARGGDRELQPPRRRHPTRLLGRPCFAPATNARPATSF